MDIKKIEANDINDAYITWSNTMKVQDYALLQYVRRVYDYAFRNNYVSLNVANQVKNGKNVKHKITRSWKLYSQEEIETILDELKNENYNSQWYYYFKLLAYTGMRKSEALALTWEKVVLNGEMMYISVNSALGEGRSGEQYLKGTKNGSDRNVYIEKKFSEELLNYKREQKQLLKDFGIIQTDKTFVFGRIRDDEVKWWYSKAPMDNLIRACNKTGVKCRGIHSFRHTHTSFLFENGLGVPEVMSRIGHSDSATTLEIYTHISEKWDEKTSNKIQAIFDKQMPEPEQNNEDELKNA